MKISVVIPTRNRLEYLKYAITSILAQDYDNWEVIVSDNDSAENVSDYISSLKEPRIKYSNTNQYISVTDNWNRALDLSTGEYVILIGDDDCIMKGAFSILSDLAIKYSKPELIYANGLHYVYPGALKDYPNGHLVTVGNWNLFNSKEPVMVEPEKMKFLSNEALNFRLHFSYNLQTLAIHRSLIEKVKIKGRFFHSPYPDFYSITLLFQIVEKVLFCPYPLSVVGLSPKSFGGLYFNNQADQGVEALNIGKEINDYPELKKYLIPGSKLNTYWLFALRSAQRNFSNTLDLKINFARFRYLQMVENLKEINNKPNRFKNFIKLFNYLNLKEKIKYGPKLAKIWFSEIRKKNKSNEIINELNEHLNVHPGHYNYQFKNQYGSILEVINEIMPYECTNHFKL